MVHCMSTCARSRPRTASSAGLAAAPACPCAARLRMPESAWSSCEVSVGLKESACPDVLGGVPFAPGWAAALAIALSRCATCSATRDGSQQSDKVPSTIPAECTPPDMRMCPLPCSRT
eukprot:350266-Chlamydomonas_euryale.AAC.6